jgi:hypothetical protein
MKKPGFLLVLVAVAAMLRGTAQAQCVAIAPGDPSVYFSTYFSNANTANAPDATLRIINDGNSGHNLSAEIYVFDDSEELTQCCTCVITPDGLLSESVNQNLTANPLTGHKPTRGVIKILSDSYVAANANNPSPFLFPGLRVSATHVQGTKVTLSPGNPVVPVEAGPYFVTETLAADSNLSTPEETLLGNLCLYDGLLSGKPCTCQPEDFDF